MKEEQKRNIDRHIFALAKSTKCNTGLLQYLIQHGILNKEEVDVIKSKAIPMDSATELYHIVQTKADSQFPYHYLSEGLKITNQTVASDIILNIIQPQPPAAKLRKLVQQESCEGSKIPTQSSRRVNIKLDVRAPVSNYTGRDEELEELHQTFCKEHVDGPRITCITGLGGIGKTQLARRYVQVYSSQYDENVIWLNAEEESLLIESFRRLAKDMLWIPTKDANGGEKNIKTVISEVYELFQGSKCLFVFDNIETGDYINNFFPQTSQDIYILMTTRDINYSIPSCVSCIRLKEMKLEDAMTFVKKGLGENLSSDQRTIQKLCTRLQCFPLALQQAISFILEQASRDDYDVKDYLDEFEDSQRELLNFGAFRDLYNDYDKTTFTTWNITVRRISEYSNVGKYSIIILHSMAYLLAEDIDREMFLPLMKDGNKRILRNAVGLLIRYSMINREEGQKLLSLHRLVQEITRMKLEGDKKDETVLSNLVGALVQEQLAKTHSFVEHSLQAWKHAYRYNNIVKKFSIFPLHLMKILMKQGLTVKAHSFATGELGLKRLKEVIPNNNENVLHVECLLCSVLENLGMLSTAVFRLKKLIPKIRLYMPEYVLTCEYMLATALYRRNEFAEALTLYLRVIENGVRLLPLEDEIKLNSLFNVAECYEKLGQKEKAIEMCLGMLPELRKIRHPREMTAQLQILRLVKGLEVNKQSRKQLLKHLINELDDITLMRLILDEAMDKYVSGESYESLQTCNLAMASLHRVKSDKALVTFHVIQARVRGNILREQGAFEEASTLQKEAYRKILNIMGEGALETKLVKIELCATWASQGKPKETVPYLKSAFKPSDTSPEIQKAVCNHFIDVFGKMKDYGKLKYYSGFVKKKFRWAEKTRLNKRLAELRPVESFDLEQEGLALANLAVATATSAMYFNMSQNF